MKHAIDELLISIFEEIMIENKTEAEWAEIESCDMFQNESYSGGYDADEQAFCFSHYSKGTEYWFQLTLSEIEEAVGGNLLEIELKEADF